MDAEIALNNNAIPGNANLMLRNGKILLDEEKVPSDGVNEDSDLEQYGDDGIKLTVSESDNEFAEEDSVREEDSESEIEDGQYQESEEEGEELENNRLKKLQVRLSLKYSLILKLPT